MSLTNLGVCPLTNLGLCPLLSFSPPPLPGSVFPIRWAPISLVQFLVVQLFPWPLVGKWIAGRSVSYNPMFPWRSPWIVGYWCVW